MPRTDNYRMCMSHMLVTGVMKTRRRGDMVKYVNYAFVFLCECHAGMNFTKKVAWPEANAASEEMFFTSFRASFFFVQDGRRRNVLDRKVGESAARVRRTPGPTQGPFTVGTSSVHTCLWGNHIGTMRQLHFMVPRRDVWLALDCARQRVWNYLAVFFGLFKFVFGRILFNTSFLARDKHRP